MITYANGQSDLCSRMRKWEPTNLGPLTQNSCNLEAWEQLEYSKPTYVKPKPSDTTKILKKIADGIKKGKLNVRV